MRKVLSWLCAFLFLISDPVFSQGISSMFPGPGTVGGGGSYTGPCDLSGVSCAVAYSTTRDMKNAYTGNLFQLIRTSDSTTLNVGTTGRVADLSGIESFCALTTCLVSRLYDQSGNGNDLVTPTAAQDANCSTSRTCLPLFFIDPATGLPIVRTTYPSSLYNAGPATGYTGGANATSVYIYGRNEGWSNCCGFFGPAHSYAQSDTAGTDFLPGLGYGTGNPFVNCSTSTTNCAKLDVEQFATDGADYSPTANQDVSYLTTFDGGSATNTITTYLNSATPIYSHSPPAATMNVGASLRLGTGGDTSHADSIFREGFVTNSALSAANYTAVAGNVSTFYSARTPNACQSTGDFGYYQSTANGGQMGNPALSSSLLAYGLRRMSASYFGPIADLRDSEGSPVTHTYGPAASGCGIDPAAVTFCTANPPCHISKLYNQGTLSTSGTPNVRDAAYDLVQATLASQPTVTFNALNGLPVMAFNGSQSMCSGGTFGGTTATFLDTAVVAERTSGTNYSPVVNMQTNTWLGWSNAANTAGTFTTATGITGALSDNAWHSEIAEWTNVASPTLTLYGSGTSLGTSAPPFDSLGINPVCIGFVSDGGSFFLTGNIAEVMIGVDANGAGITSVATTIYNLQKSVWGAGI